MLTPVTTPEEYAAIRSARWVLGQSYGPLLARACQALLADYLAHATSQERERAQAVLQRHGLAGGASVAEKQYPSGARPKVSGSRRP